MHLHQMVHSDVDIHIVGIELPMTPQDGDVIKFKMPFDRKAAILVPDGDDTPISFDALLNAKLRRIHWDELPVGQHAVPVLSDQDGAYLHTTSTPPVRVVFAARCVIEVFEVEIPLSSMSYEQEGVELELGWVMTGNARVLDRDVIFRTVVVRDEKGDFRVTRPEIIGDGLEVRELKITKDGEAFLDFGKAGE